MEPKMNGESGCAWPSCDLVADIELGYVARELFCPKHHWEAKQEVAISGGQLVTRTKGKRREFRAAVERLMASGLGDRAVDG